MKKIIYTSLLTTLLLASCSRTSITESTFSQTSESTQTQVALSSQTSTDTLGTYEEEDLDNSYDDAKSIELSDTTLEADGVSVDGQTVTITKAGTYILNGELTNGQVIVNVGKEEKVHLVLNGVTITNQQGSAILIEQAEKVITTLASDSVNTLADGTDYQLATNETEPDAAFFSKEDLVINGEGELIVTGNYSNGIRSKDDLILVSGKITVQAKNNALKGKDSIQILDGIYTLTTEEGDGIQANNSENETKGFITIDGGHFTITSGRDGIQAETDASLQNVDITIKTGTTELSSEESYKGIKAGQNILIQSGVYTIDSADDSIHSNSDISIVDGELTLTSGDDGIHADNNLTIDGGKLFVTDSYEGLEASVIVINGGDIQVVADDDGLNAGGGSDTEETSGIFGADSFGGPDEAGGPSGGDQVDESKSITISGGSLSVDAQGDGLDSNGNIQMSGGTVTVNGPTDGANGALDYNGNFEITGGTLITAGSNGMAMNVSDSSQVSLGIYFNNPQEAGTIIGLQDSSGNTVAMYQPSKSFQHVIISSSKLKVGETYTLIRGAEANGTNQNGYYEDGDIVNGIELGTLSLSDMITNLSETDEIASASMTAPSGMPNDFLR
ncbi:carbohydrate-binding domain-containing protein [Enterococcus saccharolyticus]|uniref:carbohydrate-binding domain-containing protein n=1 Tax=Enterococcus saccharolyticus TaxID=41997 RepID=UPI001E2DAEAB|nr:carbohydrate-binding domain-containing protein [Enterococcus saccharolyticus]MCD5003540.1 carbohydrate-binding domain-containing protein [Enterococcus saccharolyticus]